MVRIDFRHDRRTVEEFLSASPNETVVPLIRRGSIYRNRTGGETCRADDPLGGIMNFCDQCGQELSEGARFCAGCGTAVALAPDDAWDHTIAVQPAPPSETAGRRETATQPASGQPTPGQPSPGSMSGFGAPGGQRSAPSPHGPPLTNARSGQQSSHASGPHIGTVCVAGRALPIDLVIVAAAYVVAGLLVLWATRDAFKILPDMISGIFDDSPFVYLISYAVLYLLAIVLWIVAALVGAGYLLFRQDPVGRWIAVAVAVSLLLLSMAREDTPGGFWFAAFIAIAAAVALFVSPGATAALSQSNRGDRPAAITAARAVVAFRYSLIALSAFVGVAGLRFVSELGVSWFFMVVFQCAAAVLAWAGFARVSNGPDARGRLLISAATAMDLLALLATVSGQDTGSPAAVSVLITLGTIALINVLLWIVPAARAWFGDKPISAFQGVAGH
ncbi:zinc-ribbon domain-containing protein [Yimella sp. cx-51]|uniref:zinc-ribbon domain-containing protein n=1 Tax=Yimella sp. cx-51 TaxID=2770551 RepID=UPI00165E97E5|nr:zinc-ribbon domain-containing protein [Yimella sp. cx-51]MBC9955949.1 zinc-ribbon domain-containing protein [Yimella sp. cx-51]QTH37511.1 zinc-ribbon domain-containing protein [Yimella sp. cx-51]